jgi:sporulation protein YlmC with PRC-barrel domain
LALRLLRLHEGVKLNMKQLTIAGTILIFFASGAGALWGQTEHPVGEAAPTRGEHPAYGPAREEPLGPAPVTLEPEDAPGPILPGRQQVSSDIMNSTVYSAEGEPVGEVADLFFSPETGRLSFVVLSLRPEVGAPGQTLLGVAPEKVEIYHGYVSVAAPLEEILQTTVISEEILGALLADPELGEQIPPFVLFRPVGTTTVFGQPGQRPAAPQQTAAQQTQPTAAQPREAVVPPEVRGGVPPEFRGGVPPEQETPVPTAGTGLRPRGPTGSQPQQQQQGARQ